MQGRRVRDATSRSVMFAHAGETVSRQVPRKTGGVAYDTHPPQARQDALLPEGIR
jgi:hypothetical protein